jgi:threonine/homoserine/homoserine lactone efflux protein
MSDPIVVTYLIYLAISIALTVWVAHTLHKNGKQFLVDVFHGNNALADSVNHLLVVGFYLVNLGFVSLALTSRNQVVTARQSIELLSWKVGLVLVVLGFMHLFNVFVFNTMRRRALDRDRRPVRPPLGAQPVADWGSPGAAGS